MTMCRMIHEKNTPKGKSQQLKLLDITQYIDHHLEEDLSLDDLAGIFYVSKYYIAHRFRERLGISVHQYILKKRLEQCAASIARGSSITRTFTEYGFRDYASFYRAFRKEYGISPKEYQEASA
jgi:AraC-like DNA-binding protein